MYKFSITFLIISPHHSFTSNALLCLKQKLENNFECWVNIKWKLFLTVAIIIIEYSENEIPKIGASLLRWSISPPRRSWASAGVVPVSPAISVAPPTISPPHGIVTRSVWPTTPSAVQSLSKCGRHGFQVHEVAKASFRTRCDLKKEQCKALLSGVWWDFKKRCLYPPSELEKEWRGK